MKNLVRQIGRLALLTMVFAMSAVMAQAQSDTGTVTINGSVGNAASLRWWSFTNNATSGANAPNTQNSPLAFTLDLGDVSANNTNAYVGGTVQVVMRTNAAYTLSAALTASSGFGTAANGDIALSDIGFGLQNLAASGTGALVTATAVGGSSIAGTFDNDPGAATLDADGVPSFDATLDDLATSTPGTTVLSGPRISQRGAISSPNNGLLADTIYTVVPQFFTPTASFSATVTYTLATP